MDGDTKAQDDDETKHSSSLTKRWRSDEHLWPAVPSLQLLAFFCSRMLAESRNAIHIFSHQQKRSPFHKDQETTRKNQPLSKFTKLCGYGTEKGYGMQVSRVSRTNFLTMKLYLPQSQAQFHKPSFCISQPINLLQDFLGCLNDRQKAAYFRQE